MVIIWKGKGWIIFVITLVVSCISELTLEYLTQDENFYQDNIFALPLNLLICGIVTYYIAHYLKGKAEKSLHDNILDTKIQSENENEYNKFDDTLFFIPIVYYPYIFLASAIGTILYRIL